MELVGFSAGGSVLGSTGLGTCLNTKKKYIESIYSHAALYKKPKKSEAGDVLVNSSIGPLALKNISISGDKPTIGSVVSSVSGLSDIENMANTVAEKTSYAESGKDDNINNIMPRKTCT
ncbi:hypothetical protein G9A89_021219 [Geosiphon pyriformis]|nr:hypothetical protein G9A89_021219 [Geosiphon pyriformis]